MLIGQFLVKVGEKGRIAFPKRFRDVLGDKIIVTYGFEQSLMVVSEKNWKALLEGSENKPFLSSSTRSIRRFLLGGASLGDLDPQGRFVLPEYLRKFALIQDEAVIVGQNSYVEIWDSKKWNAHIEAAQKNISDIAETLIDSFESSK